MVDATAATTAATTGGLMSVGSSSLTREDFLMLLVTQLQSQDPLNPQDSTEFTAQLAQFSALEQQMNSNELLMQLMSLEAAVANTNSASFIGRNVTAYSEEIGVHEGNISQVQVNLLSGADDVTITIRDGSGATVRVIEMGSLDSGMHDIEWDGTDMVGNPVSDGSYTFSVEATANGEAVETEPIVFGLVEGVEFDTNGTFLIINGERVALANIIAVESANSVSA
jgi:flagellar basal-body rod modification protein FlgD